METLRTDTPTDETAAIRAARRRLRTVRWSWLLLAIAVYAAWDVVDQTVLIPYDFVLGGFGIDWSVVTVLGLMLMLLISQWGDQQLAQLEAQIARTVSAERSALQLTTAEATARADTLAAAEQYKSTLLAAVSHDFRTPLAAITAAADELLTDDVQWSPDAAHEFAGIIHTEATRLTRLVANLLDLTRIEAGMAQPQRGWYNLAEILNQVLERCRPDLIGRPLELAVPDDLPLIPVDYTQLEQVLWNVIQNALMYTPLGSPLTITAAHEEGQLVLRVADRGPGIPPAEQMRVFEPFYRLQPWGQPAVQGIGIGLAICKGLIEAHGGRITIQDRAGGGALVQICLPCQLAVPHTNGEAVHATATYSSHR